MYFYFDTCMGWDGFMYGWDGWTVDTWIIFPPLPLDRYINNDI